MKTLMRSFSILFILMVSFAAQAMEIKLTSVADGVYAFVGPTDDRTPENLGLNANIGFVKTTKGVVLIDSGAGFPAAKALEAAAKQQLHQPIIAVINTGSQDHRWLGNAYFAQKHIPIYALEATVKTQKKMAQQELDHLAKIDAKFFKPFKTVTADHVLKGDHAKVVIGNTVFKIQRFGDTHFPGDAVVWLPQKKVLFSGDMIYIDRILGIHPWSNVITWQKAYHEARKLPAKVIVPGHGRPCDWTKADKETGAYLDKLISRLTSAAEDMAGVDAAVVDNKDWPEFKHLKHYDSWHKTNVNRAYLQIESNM